MGLSVAFLSANLAVILSSIRAPSIGLMLLSPTVTKRAVGFKGLSTQLMPSLSVESRARKHRQFCRSSPRERLPATNRVFCTVRAIY